MPDTPALVQTTLEERATAVARSRRRRPPLGRAYWNLLGAAAVSNLGDGLLIVALPLLIASLDPNPAVVAGCVAVQGIAWLLCSLPAGALVDRLDRARLMATVDGARAVLLGVLALAVATDVASVALVYLGAAALGGLESLFLAGSFAAVPALVDERGLDRANGWLFSTETAGEQLAGPALGGILFAAAAWSPFLLDAATFAVSALLLVRLRRPLARAVAPQRTRVSADIIEGLRWFWRNPLLRLLSVVVGGLAACQAMVVSLLVLYGLEELDMGTSGYGLFLAVTALGNVVGGVIADRVGERLGAAGTVVASGAVAALAYIGMGLASSPWLAGALLAMEGVAVAFGMVTSLSLRQSSVPDELRGRVGNAFRMVIFAMAPAGALLGGVVATAFSLRGTFVAAGFVQLAIVAVAAAPLIRLAGRRLPVIDLREQPLSASHGPA